jgi:transcriptional regulator with XRE-family HTH domain
MSDAAALNAILASRIGQARETSGMSVEELARRALLKPERVKRILAGSETISFDQIILLAGALGVEPRSLFSGIEWVPDGEGGGEYRISEDSD